jgi:hypothetical protein
VQSLYTFGVLAGCLCVCSFCHAEPLVVEQEISIAAASETGVEHKILSVKQCWILQAWWMLLKIFLTKKNCLRTLFFCVILNSV